MKTAIVTGATRGIGKQIAIDLAKEGYHVVINYSSNEQTALDVKKECDAYEESIIYKADVSDPKQCEELVRTTIEKFGQIDVLVNNAGITKDNLILRMKEEDYQRVISVNLDGTFYMCKYTSKEMMKKRCGRIINISSIVGEIGNIGQSNYAASKGGIIALTKSLSKELASRNILVNCIAPGFIQTDMTDVLSEEMKNKLLEQIPLKRLGTPKDVSNMVLFLTSDASSYVTGQVLNVCGGMVI